MRRELERSRTRMDNQKVGVCFNLSRNQNKKGDQFETRCKLFTKPGQISLLKVLNQYLNLRKLQVFLYTLYTKSKNKYTFIIHKFTTSIHIFCVVPSSL